MLLLTLCLHFAVSCARLQNGFPILSLLTHPPPHSWPSFNGAFGLDNQYRVAINTALALLGSIISTAFTSHFCKGHFDMVTIQNATLAGGVAVGTASDLLIGPPVASLLSRRAFMLLRSLFLRSPPLCSVLALASPPPSASFT